MGHDWQSQNHRESEAVVSLLFLFCAWKARVGRPQVNLSRKKGLWACCPRDGRGRISPPLGSSRLLTEDFWRPAEMSVNDHYTIICKNRHNKCRWYKRWLQVVRPWMSNQALEKSPGKRSPHFLKLAYFLGEQGSSGWIISDFLTNNDERSPWNTI